MTTISGENEERTRRARVIYDYEGDDDSQLSITTGQILTLIGEVTPENWILAQTKDGTEGYIPDGYFEVLSDSKKKKGGKTKAAPPPIPKDATGGGAYVYHDNDDDGMVLEHNDTYSLFSYQLEWFTIPCIFIGALLSFMYSTPQISEHKWRLGICSWLTFIVSAVAAYICGINRTKFKLCGSAALVRMIVFLIASLLLFASYPIGIASAIICLLTALIELRLHFLKCKDLPSRITDEWCSTMFGGTENCPPLKLIIFFIVLAIDGGVFGWGYVDGYNFAININEENPSFWLEPMANAFMWGFARIITINLCLILLLQCKGCFLWCFTATKGFVEERFCKNKQKSGKKKGRESEVNISDFLHRCMGYSIVVGTFLHLICVYFTYEDSLSTHSFLDIYGWETFGTGWLCCLLLASVVASSNETLAKTNQRLFKQTHYQSVILVFVLIAHGKNFISTYYWMLIIAPIILYSCDIFVRYLKGN